MANDFFKYGQAAGGGTNIRSTVGQSIGAGIESGVAGYIANKDKEEKARIDRLIRSDSDRVYGGEGADKIFGEQKALPQVGEEGYDPNSPAIQQQADINKFRNEYVDSTTALRLQRWDGNITEEEYQKEEAKLNSTFQQVSQAQNMSTQASANYRNLSTVDVNGASQLNSSDNVAIWKAAEDKTIMQKRDDDGNVFYEGTVDGEEVKMSLSEFQKSMNFVKDAESTAPIIENLVKQQKDIKRESENPDGTTTISNDVTDADIDALHQSLKPSMVGPEGKNYVGSQLLDHRGGQLDVLFSADEDGLDRFKDYLGESELTQNEFNKLTNKEKVEILQDAKSVGGSGAQDLFLDIMEDEFKDSFRGTSTSKVSEILKAKQIQKNLEYKDAQIKKTKSDLNASLKKGKLADADKVKLGNYLNFSIDNNDFGSLQGLGGIKSLQQETFVDEESGKESTGFYLNGEIEIPIDGNGTPTPQGVNIIRNFLLGNKDFKQQETAIQGPTTESYVDTPYPASDTKPKLDYNNFLNN